MEVTDTAYNGFILCTDCKYRSDDLVEINKEFHCDRHSMIVKNVGICKYYRKAELIGAADGNDKNSEK